MTRRKRLSGRSLLLNDTRSSSNAATSDFEAHTRTTMTGIHDQEPRRHLQGASTSRLPSRSRAEGLRRKAIPYAQDRETSADWVSRPGRKCAGGASRRLPPGEGLALGAGVKPMRKHGGVGRIEVVGLLLSLSLDSLLPLALMEQGYSTEVGVR